MGSFVYQLHKDGSHGSASVHGWEPRGLWFYPTIVFCTTTISIYRKMKTEMGPRRFFKHRLLPWKSVRLMLMEHGKQDSFFRFHPKPCVGMKRFDAGEITQKTIILSFLRKVDFSQADIKL